MYFQNFNARGERLWFRISESAWKTLRESERTATIYFTNPATRIAYVIPVRDIEEQVQRVRAQRGKLHLDTGEIVFRGPVRLMVRLGDVRRAEAREDSLVIRHQGGEAAFAVGATAAARWAERIPNPPSRLDKFGVRPGMKVVLLDLAEPDFAAELAAHAGTVATTRRARGAAR